MNNYFSLSPIKCDSFITKKEVQVTFDPVKFLELKKFDILYQLCNMEYSEEEAYTRYTFMIEIINNLKPLRACISKTFDYIDETVKEIPCRAKTITINFLLQATANNKSYSHAHNCFGHHATRFMLYPVSPSFTPEHEILEQIEQESKQDGIKAGPNNQLKEKLSLQQIALKYAWEGKSITKQNKDEIASQFGYKSGDKLYENYCMWSKRANRIADPDGTKKQIENKIERFESVIKLLTEKNKQSALDELKILQTILKNTYLKNSNQL
jgi:hypothetical protein